MNLSQRKQNTILTKHSKEKKKKQWLEGVGELPAAEEAGKYYKGVHEAEYFVLPSDTSGSASELQAG